LFLIKYRKYSICDFFKPKSEYHQKSEKNKQKQTKTNRFKFANGLVRVIISKDVLSI